jgi:hypothetical protein
MNTWKHQYLKEEKLHYLTEHHPNDGILTELFFETPWELYDYIYDNAIMINNNNDDIATSRDNTPIGTL